jgi:hypothetical protein
MDQAERWTGIALALAVLAGLALRLAPARLWPPGAGRRRAEQLVLIAVAALLVLYLIAQARD